jgi:hypothetical protein
MNKKTAIKKRNACLMFIRSMKRDVIYILSYNSICKFDFISKLKTGIKQSKVKNLNSP